MPGKTIGLAFRHNNYYPSDSSGVLAEQIDVPDVRNRIAKSCDLQAAIKEAGPAGAIRCHRCWTSAVDEEMMKEITSKSHPADEILLRRSLRPIELDANAAKEFRPSTLTTAV